MGFVNVGKVHSAQGLKGEVFVWIFAGEAHWFDQWDTLYLCQSKALEPEKSLAIKKARPHSKQQKWGFALNLDGVNDRNQAEAIEKLDVLVPEEFLISGEDDNIYLREVLEFEVIDQSRGPVGRVKGFSGSSFQDLLIIENEVGKYEVPFVEPLLVEIKRNEKQILMDIPQGLVAGEEL